MAIGTASRLAYNERKAPRLVVRVIRVNGREYRGEGATESEAFKNMVQVEG